MSREVEIRAPADETEGTRSQILRWLKAVGESVTENEPLIEVETDKVTVEVAAPGTGTLREILKQEREEIDPGELLGRIEAVTAATPEHATASAAGASAVVQLQPTVAAAAGANGAITADSQSHGSRTPAAAISAASHSPGDRSAAQALSPAVRRLLAQHGLEASAIRGTGQGARVTVEDVLAHVANGGGRAVGSKASPATGAAANVNDSLVPCAADTVGARRRVPHTVVRKRIAEHMVQSLLHTAPHVTTVFEADLSEVLLHRQRNQEEFARHGAPLTLTAYFLEAAVAAIRAVPEANSRWTEAALEFFDSIHIGVATALDSGLVVPVLRDVQSRDLLEIAQGLEDLVSRARAGRLEPGDVRGGTFTISNHGVSGSLVATPIIINQPQAAILGVGKLEKRPVVVTDGGEDRIVIQPRCYVTLTIDHRVMDGHQANHFLRTFVQRLATSRP